MLELDSDDIKAFLAESYENINQIETDIVDLEKTSTVSDKLVNIYRYLHTIKGNCGFLAFSKLEAVAHAGESLLGKLREGRLKINAEIITILLQTIDNIRNILSNIEASNSEGEEDYSYLIQTINNLGVGSGELAIGSEELGVGSGESIEIKEETISALPLSSPSSPPLPTPHSPLPTSQSSIRVDIELLDKMMNLVGELVLTRNQFLQFGSDLEDTKFNTISQRLNLISSELQFGVMKTRMQPINTIWQKLHRVVRDVAVVSGKQVQVEIIGGETELDRNIIEAIKDPTMHLVRNCIDHGIETPEVRISCGKPVQGKLRLRAFHEGSKVNIEISDDGKGIEWDSIKRKAQEIGLISSTQVKNLSKNEAFNLIFSSGLSTSSHVSNLSGRGVGMDVVKTNIERVNGTIQIYSQPGEGTTFKIKIPLTLAIIPVLIISSGKQFFTIPQASIQELVRLESGVAINNIEELYDIPVLRLRGKILPIVYLNKIFGFEETQNADTIYIVVIKAEDYHFGLVVDAIEDTQDIVVKPLGQQLKDMTVFSGATILGNGQVALIIDAVILANLAGVTSQIQQRLSTVTSTTNILEDDRQMILLFQAGENTRMGIPISLANRLEEFPYAAIETIGNQKVIQYRGEVLSLIDLKTVFPDNWQNIVSREIIQVVVVSLNQKHNFGIIVGKILDIVEEPLKVLGTPTRLGIKTLAVIQNQITEILDIENVIHIANPYLLRGVGEIREIGGD
ncbi:MAG: chemotaxis protein CheW [Scytonematopsis contorta HA4267-MV1]|jgi:two-component system chemotaxis sensor kinase CheA|nr:chemotaxis protein CheW [Scytonematopsis contorta HA4267-MV1]